MSLFVSFYKSLIWFFSVFIVANIEHILLVRKQFFSLCYHMCSRLAKTFNPQLLFGRKKIDFRRVSAGHWFTGQSDTIILQSKWHNQHLHKSYQHRQAPRAPAEEAVSWLPSRMGAANHQRVTEDRHSRAAAQRCHSGGAGISFPNGNHNKLHLNYLDFYFNCWISAVCGKKKKMFVAL